MRKLAALAVVASLLSSSACAPKVLVKKRRGAGESFRVAVLPFKDAPGMPGSGELAAEAFRTHILAIEAYDIVDRGALEELMKEQKLGLSGAIDAAEAAKIGKLLGADAVVTGSVADLKERNLLMFPPAKVSLTARMVHVETGAVEWSVQHTAGGARRWLTLIVWPVWLVATVVSPTSEDLIQKTARAICRSLSEQLAPPL